MFLFVFFLSRSEASAPFVQGVHSLNKHCVAVYRSISTRFSAFFRRMSLSGHCIVLIFVARWRHKFHEIAVKYFDKSKNRRKSLCARLRIDSATTGWLTDRHMQINYDMRVHRHSLYQSQIRYDTRKYSFSNSLPEKVVSSSTVKSFKVRLEDSGQMKKLTITIKPIIMHRKSK